MKNERRTKGFTLIEILVTFAVVLMLSGIMVLMVIRGKTIWQSSVTRSASRQEIQVLSQKIAQELKSGDAAFITDGSVGNLKAFSFVSAYGEKGSFITDDSGAPVWQKYVIYYIKTGTTNLLRKEIPITSSQLTDLKSLTLPQLSGYMDGTGVLASPSVSSIKILPDTDNNSAIMDVTTEAKNRNGKIDRQSMQLSVSMYN